MSLYDGIPMDDPPAPPPPMRPPRTHAEAMPTEKKVKREEDAEPAASGATWSSAGLKLLQSQMHLKKAQATLAMREKQRYSSQPTTPVVPAVVDLSARCRDKAPAAGGTTPSLLKPRKALVLEDMPPLSFIPKAVKEDKVWLFGEVLLEDEYNPLIPSDYEKARRRRDEERTRIKVEERKRELEERDRQKTSRAHEEDEMEAAREAHKRTAGAAIAPPQALIEADSRQLEQPSAVPSFIPSFGSGSKGLGVAANIMSKMGYKEGSGLGRLGQGMSTALKVSQAGRGAGIIIHENDEAKAGFAMPWAPSDQSSAMSEALKQPTKILLLRNMVSLEDVDDELEPEVRDEMLKYGQVTNVIVFKMPQPICEEESVRIFVEFFNVAQAIKAFVDLNGRFFGGRSIRAGFYSIDSFLNMDYTLPVSYGERSEKGRMAKQQPIYRAQRVAQLDASTLDDDLRSILWDQLSRGIESLPIRVSSFIGRYDAELQAALAAAMWAVSLRRSGATLGQQSMDMRFVYFQQTPPAFTKNSYLLLSVVLPYILHRLPDWYSHLFVNADNDDGGGSTTVVERWCQRADRAMRLLHLFHFVAFLRFGGYQTALERLLSLRAVHTEQPTLGSIDFETMNRELLWHGFADALLFVLPFVNLRKLQSWVKIFRKHRNEEEEPGAVQSVVDARAMAACPVCGETPTVPAMAGCKHFFCYYCLRGSLLADVSFTCPLCDRSLDERNFTLFA
uniref:Peroxisome biogenesis factor 2 n=1 Tax=Plectus sambesii TaxID=2011161 RepID=A0A914XPP8_9BILA